MKKIYLLTSFTVALLTLSACNFERSGNIASLSGNINNKASYSFKFNGCTTENVDTFKFHDKRARVKAQGTIDSVVLCQQSSGDPFTDLVNNINVCTECPAGNGKARFTYDPSSPRTLNGGTGHACIGFSNTDGVLKGETLSVEFETGRHAGVEYAESAITDEKIRLEEACPAP